MKIKMGIANYISYPTVIIQSYIYIYRSYQKGLEVLPSNFLMRNIFEEFITFEGAYFDEIYNV